MDELKAVENSDQETVTMLNHVIGAENTVKLIEHFGGTYMYIPLMKTVTKEERDKLIYADYSSGMSFLELGQKYSLAQSSLRDLVNKMRRNNHGRKQHT